MDLSTAWFLLIGVLLGGYAVLDGFDLGVGFLHLFTRSEKERRIYLNAIGPVWDGNEVWLLTAFGAMFAAFPVLYATVLSGFYLAIMLLLFALIMRAVAIEFRGKVGSPLWRRIWDWSFGLGSLIPAAVFGVAIGNVLQGLPIAADGSLNVAFLDLLNPYSLLTGILGLSICVMHGSVFLTLKTEGVLQQRIASLTNYFWATFIILYVVTTTATYFVSPFLFQDLLDKPLFWALILFLLAGNIYLPIANRGGKHLRAFLASAVVILSAIGLTGLGLYPRMAVSSIDPAFSLTAYNAASSANTLSVMLAIVLIGMPLVIAYTAWIYFVFRGKVTLSEDSY